MFNNLKFSVMKNATINAGKKVSNVITTKKTTEKKAVEKKVSNYKANVIETNQKLNVEKNSLGAYLDVLLKYKNLLCVEFQIVVVEIRVNNNKEIYDNLSKLVRTSSKGKYNQFYTLQGLQKLCFPKK